MNSEFERTLGIFFPYEMGRRATLQEGYNRFVYYTNAETALKIIRNGEFWLRNPLLMNDFKEVDHGLECLSHALDGPAGYTLKDALEQCYPGLADEVQDFFERLEPIIRTKTYTTCFSEHSLRENARGRLSMWRAYGGTTGVAIVVKGDLFHSTMNIGAVPSPVFYGDKKDFEFKFRLTADGIANQVSFLKSFEKEKLIDAVLEYFRISALCTKHPGFEDELEWRVIASPNHARLSSDIVTLRGVPQRVVKIKLANSPGAGVVGLALPELIDRIIVGPCKFPDVTAMALRDSLLEVNADVLASRVHVTDIPLRHDE